MSKNQKDRKSSDSGQFRSVRQCTSTPTGQIRSVKVEFDNDRDWSQCPVPVKFNVRYNK